MVVKENDKNASSSQKGSKSEAAKFVGVEISEVLGFRKAGDRYIVVTIAGQKLTEGADERDARVEAELKVARKAAQED